MEGHVDCILTFLLVFESSVTNNEAERAFRMMRVRVKISGCIRTLHGACRHARVHICVSTLRKHGLPRLE